jgi:putative membrane protein
MPVADAIPYCGPPPQPGELATSWNLDPPLIAALALLALVYAAGAWRAGDALALRARGAFATGLSVLVIAFVSPLCSLGVALFAARVGQHLLLALVAAPLLVLGRPMTALRALASAGSGRLSPGGAGDFDPEPSRSPAALGAGTAFAIALWLWHAPAPYDATLRSDGLYWLMHLSLLGAACWLWAALLRRDAGGRFAAGALGLGTSLQMGLLGALLVFAPRPLYASHLATAPEWGLSPLADQALGGLLCWVPGCAAFAAAGLAVLSHWLSPADGGAPGELPATATLAADPQADGSRLS